MADPEFDYIVAVHAEDGSYWAEVRELPGCLASGESMDELWEALAEAMSLYLSEPGNPVLVHFTSITPYLGLGDEVDSEEEYKVLAAC